MSYTPTDDDYKWASRVARSYIRKVHLGSLEDDAAQEACIAVWRGARNYDRLRGVTFRQYVIKRITGSVKDLIRLEIGRNGQELSMRNGIAVDDSALHNDEVRIQLEDNSKSVLDRLIEQEKIRRLYEFCFADYERWQLDSWAGLLTQQSIASRRRVSEAYVSLCARQLRTELQVTFDMGESI